jgi:GDPmannose 4,6-dehydratase
MIEPPSGMRVMISGVTGQDGGIMARKLLPRGCRVSGLVDPENDRDTPLREIPEGIETVSCDLAVQAEVEAAVCGFQPEIIYHLAAQSSVGRSWDDPVGTARVNSMGTLYLLEAIRKYCPRCAFVLAGSCDCFDHEAMGGEGVTPETPICSTNPYSASKVMAHKMAHCYRDHFGLRVSVAILFNHTSPGRPENFIERRVVRGLVKVALGIEPGIVIGGLDRKRDWSWAEDIVDAYARMGMLDEPADLVLASGRLHRIGDWAEEVCRHLDLDIDRVIKIDSSLMHPGDRDNTFGDIRRAGQLLGWEPCVSFEEMAKRLMDHDLAELKQ